MSLMHVVLKTGVGKRIEDVLERASFTHFRTHISGGFSENETFPSLRSDSDAQFSPSIIIEYCRHQHRCLSTALRLQVSLLASAPFSRPSPEVL
jgi:hypothetical protein